MPKSSGAWKASERVVAEFFGTRRTPLSGGNSGHTRSDTLSKTLFVEHKHYQNPAVWNLWESTAKLAKLENKIPIVTQKKNNKTGFLITVHCDDLEKFIAAYHLIKSEKELFKNKSECENCHEMFNNNKMYTNKKSGEKICFDCYSEVFNV